MASSTYRSVPASSGRPAQDFAAAATTTRSTDGVKTPDLCVIGGGAGGLTVAAAAAALGVSVVLIEKHKMGGDCLNAGCVPSKALIAAGKRARDMRSAGEVGIRSVEPSIDMRRVRARIATVVDRLAPNDAAERFQALGVDVVRAAGRFVDARTVQAGDVLVRARRFVIATGTSPAIPNIPGLETVPYLTNETMFDNDAAIGHLVVVGGGAVGMEIAQAYRRLGTRVTVLDQGPALAREDRELSGVVIRHLRQEGVIIEEGVTIDGVGGKAGALSVQFTRDGAASTVVASHLLIAAGRTANIDKLGLETAKIRIASERIQVDAGMRSSNRRVFAIGGVAGGEHTHTANAQAEIVIRRALFRQPARIVLARIPRVVFTDPEIAQVGPTEAEARKLHGKLSVFRWPFADNDRAVIENAGSGLIKVICDPNRKIVGAGIAGRDAGELIHVWSLAISQGLTIDAMAHWTAPYPTLGEVSKRVAVSARAEQARRPVVRKLLTILRKLG